MRIMNKLFANLVRNNSVNYQGDPDVESTKDNQDGSLDLFIGEQIITLLQNIFEVIKENLNSVIQTEDGIYSLLFIKNCLKYL